MSTIEPSLDLTRVSNYVSFAHGPTFLAIKPKNRVQEGPHHHVKETSMAREHCTEKEIVFKTIQDNGFMVHHESVLLFPLKIIN
jgi:hypothetical protein